MADELLQRAKTAVELALDKGASGAWASTSASRNTSCSLRNGEIEKVQESNSRRLSLELYVDGRYFTHDTSDMAPDRLEGFVTEAVALTRAIEPDPYRQLPDPNLHQGAVTQGLDAEDPTLAELDIDRRVALCREMHARTSGKPKVLSVSTSMSDGRWQSAAVSSNGFEGQFGATWAGLYTSVTMRDAGDRRPEAGMGANARHFADLPETTWIGDEALRLATDRLGSGKGPSMKATMVVDPRVAGRLLFSLLGPAHGRAVQQGRSFWAGKLGKKVLSKKLALVDDPHLPRANGSRPYDGEGIAAKRRTVIEGGALQTYFLDTYYARKLDMQPTSGGWSNLVVTPGKGDLESIVSGVDRGVYVTSWLGGNSDSTSGEFSFGLRGHLIEKGKLGAPVGEMNVTGNIVELFSQLSAVGSDPWIYGSVRSPTLAFDRVSFSGA
jgi:PmbA protein